MCYSAMVEQRLKTLASRTKAALDMDMLLDLFQRRLTDDSIKLTKALEANFEAPDTPAARRIKKAIDAYRKKKAEQWEAEVFAQRKRLANAERALKTKITKKAQEDQRIATRKIDHNRKRLADLTRTTAKPNDSRIFPFWYAPVLVMEEGARKLVPMRYHCRSAGKPASYDRRYPGLYNARRDNLEGYWKNVFGRRHAVALVTGFFENVALHDFEHRALRKGEAETNVVLHFSPEPSEPMWLACLWDVWEAKGQDPLYSFAIVTDEPPPEVAATGHNRCPIPLKAKNVDTWLTPAGHTPAELYAVLDDRERPYYEHERAA